MNPDLPNPAAGGRPGALQFAGFGDNSCQCRTPIETYYGNVGPRLGVAYSLTDRTVLRGSYGIMYSRRGAVGGRGGARNGTGLLGFSANATFPSTNSFAPAYNWNNGVPSYAAPPFFDPTLNSGFATGRPSGGDVTYGDPEIGGRPPRYQNWNAGAAVRADAIDDDRRDLRRQQGRRARRHDARVLLESARSAISGARQPADADGDARPTSPRRRPSCLAWACPTRTSPAPSRRCCGRSRNTTASTTSTATSRARRITRCS